jgi:hypothetical protein
MKTVITSILTSLLLLAFNSCEEGNKNSAVVGTQEDSHGTKSTTATPATSDNQIVGKWKCISLLDGALKGDDVNAVMILNGDKTCTYSDDIGTRSGTWRIQNKNITKLDSGKELDMGGEPPFLTLSGIEFFGVTDDLVFPYRLDGDQLQWDFNRMVFKRVK